MTVAALLDEMVAALTAAGIPCMLTGSFAAAVHGVGRATMDIDLVIEPDAAGVARFVSHMIDSGRYVSPEAAQEAVTLRSLFNVVDVETGWKIDLIVRKDRAFSRSEFNRRREMTLGGVRVPVTSIEDLVLAKLEWARQGGSARQLEDVRALLRLAGPAFDWEYARQWIAVLGVESEWRLAGLGDEA